MAGLRTWCGGCTQKPSKHSCSGAGERARAHLPTGGASAELAAGRAAGLGSEPPRPPGAAHAPRIAAREMSGGLDRQGMKGGGSTECVGAGSGWEADARIGERGGRGAAARPWSALSVPPSSKPVRSCRRALSSTSDSRRRVLHGLGLQPRLRRIHSSPKRTSCARSPAQTETTSREARYCLVSTAKS